MIDIIGGDNWSITGDRIEYVSAVCSYGFSETFDIIEISYEDV